MEILAKHEPQELRIDDAEESKSSAVQVVQDPRHWSSSAFQGRADSGARHTLHLIGDSLQRELLRTHESEREESGSPAMEDK